MELWYKDAIIYEVHVRAFYDSNGDGIGDFRGLAQKLDYLQNLGITCIWLLPICPSPLKDDGYDISDYKNIHPDYGTLRDFKEFLKQAHRRGIRVITELTLNHTSDQHEWFQKSRLAKPGSAWRNYYVWSETPDKYKDARIIFKDFERSNWTWDETAKAYYWHRFYSHQPDLNYDNPKVRRAIMDVVDFWFDLGVDGLRLDAVPYLYEKEGTNCENLPETHAFLKELRAHVEKKFKDKMLLAEANQWPEDALEYFGKGDECHMAFNFPVMPRMFMSVQMEDRFPLVDIFDPPLEIPKACQWALFLRNHDELTLEMVTDEERDYMYRAYATDPRTRINLGIRRRLAPLLGNNLRKIELMNVLLVSLPGTPVLYYGDEIGMGDNYYLGDRNGVRTPMQWGSDRNADFSNASPHKLYLPVVTDPEYHYEAINVENQEAHMSSMLWRMKRLLAMRKNFKAFSRGSIKFLSSQNPKILAFIREYEGETMLSVTNLSRFSQAVELDLGQYAGLVPEEVFSNNDFPVVRETPYLLTMGPHNYFWFKLRKEAVGTTLAKERVVPLLEMNELKELTSDRTLQKIKKDVLGTYLRSCRWFRSKGRVIRGINISEIARSDSAHFLFLEVSYNEGLPETYLLPLFYLSKEKAAAIEQQFPQSVIAHLKAGEEEGVLFDGVYCEGFQRHLLDLIAKKKRFKGKNGEFIAYPGSLYRSLLSGKTQPLSVSVQKAEQTNTSINYDEAFILKLFRKLEMGIHPDVEVVRALTEKARSSEIPPFAGTLEYRRKGAEPIYLALLQAYVHNEGDAWSFALDNMGHYFERILSRKEEFKEVPKVQNLLTCLTGAEENPALKEVLGGIYPEMIALLGQRTGELHLSLYSISNDPDFSAEPFSQHYQRSIFQSMRSMQRQSFSCLRKFMDRLADEIKAEASEVLKAENQILDRFSKVMGKKISAMKIRIHGDFHLGQVLYTGKDFMIIDFEGEPARSLSERRLKRSALRDVAGMIRSFHYAAYAALFNHPGLRPEDRVYLEPWIKALYNYLGGIYLCSYLKTVGKAAFLPQEPEEFRTLFEAFLLEKAVYELGYELNNRPDWVVIPIKGVSYILKGDK